MATSSPPAGQSMRQQLDELDALLQRMLNLPIHQSDESSSDVIQQRARFTNTADPSPTPPPPAGRRPSLMLLDGSAPVVPPQSPPEAWDAHWNINLNPQQGSSVFGSRSPAQTRAPSTAPAAPVWRAETVAFAPRDAAPAPQPVMPNTPLRNEEPPAARTVAASRSPLAEPAPLVLVPIVAVNRIFDGAMLALGPPGEWLCTRTGRAALGLVGFGLLIASAVWGGIGWYGWPG